MPLLFRKNNLYSLKAWGKCSQDMIASKSYVYHNRMKSGKGMHNNLN